MLSRAPGGVVRRVLALPRPLSLARTCMNGSAGIDGIDVHEKLGSLEAFSGAKYETPKGS